MKTKGASGPLTLRCNACGRRNVGNKKPIKSTGYHRINKGRSKYAARCSETLVECVCKWTFWTNFPAMQDKDKGDA
jgi:hypothetical protein